MNIHSKQLRLILIIIVLAALSGIAIFVGSKAEDNQSTEDSSAATQAFTDSNGNMGYINENGDFVYSGGANQEPQNCGRPCENNSDCISRNNWGDSVMCYRGTCRNSACPEDENAVGAECLCKEKKSCGEPCGYAAGGAGCGSDSVCMYINGSDCKNKYLTYCVPVGHPDVEKLKCKENDTGNSYLHLTSDPTKINFDAWDVIELCNQPFCGNGTCDGSETLESCEQDCAQGSGHADPPAELTSMADNCGSLDNDNNNSVDLVDLIALLSYYERTCSPASSDSEAPACGYRDSNSDLTISLVDIINALTKYNRSCSK